MRVALHPQLCYKERMSTIPGLRTFASLSSSLLLAGVLSMSAGCGETVECVVDTDCELGNRCQAQVCTPLSTTPQQDSGTPVEDAGPAEDAGPEEDAGPAEP